VLGIGSGAVRGSWPGYTLGLFMNFGRAIAVPAEAKTYKISQALQAGRHCLCYMREIAPIRMQPWLQFTLGLAPAQRGLFSVEQMHVGLRTTASLITTKGVVGFIRLSPGLITADDETLQGYHDNRFTLQDISRIGRRKPIHPDASLPLDFFSYANDTSSSRKARR
jgi:hypothetical protein